MRYSSWSGLKGLEKNGQLVHRDEGAIRVQPSLSALVLAPAVVVPRLADGSSGDQIPGRVLASGRLGADQLGSSTTTGFINGAMSLRSS